MEWIDTHAHLPHIAERGVSVEPFLDGTEIAVIDIGTLPDDLEPRLAMKNGRNGRIAFTAGLYPALSAEPQSDIDRAFKQFRETVLRHRSEICGIGEFGLDFYCEGYGSPEKQRALAQKQIELAAELGLPVVIHSRNADEEIIRLFSDYAPVRGVIHCFSSGPETAEKLLEEADALFDAGDFVGAGEKYLDSAAEYAADWRPWFGVVKVQTKDFTDFSEIYDCQNAYDRALRRMGEKERAALAEKYVPSMERIVSESEEKADALEQEDAAIREAKLPAAHAEFKALGVRLIVFAALFAVFAVVCGVTATLIGRVRSALILIPPIACGVIAVACLFIAAVYLKKFLAARSAYRAAQLPLTSPAGRECAKLREYAELVQSVIDDFQKA